MLAWPLVLMLAMGCEETDDPAHDPDAPEEETDPPGDDDDDDDDYELPSGCEILTPYAGTYTVTGLPEEDPYEPTTGEHERGTVLIGADCAIDYDLGVAFTADEVQAIYDRTQQDHSRRVQVSYGADDDGPVINVYLTEALEVHEIQFRHRDDGVNLRVLVE